MDAAAYRAEAEAFRARDRFEDAIRSRTRALVAELTERGVLVPRDGRTAGDVAREAAALVPAVSQDVAVVTSAFERVWYGGAKAQADLDDLVRDAETRVRKARLTVSATAGAQLVAPR